MSGDLVAGRMLAYRAWTVHVDGRLHSLHKGGAWDTAEMTATCDPGVLWPHPDPSPAPARSCTCGLYAYYRPESVRPSTLAAEVFGVVEVSGRVILATRGLKAERMRILGLVSDNGWIAEVAARYDVAMYPSRDALLSDFPPQDYSGLVDVDPSDVSAYGTGGFVIFSVNVDLAPFIKAIKDAALSAAQAGENLRQAGIALRSSQQADPAVDVRARALELRKNRNTGPGAGRMDGRWR